MYLESDGATVEQFDVGQWHGCGVHPDGTVSCWGNTDEGQQDAPAGTFKTVSAGLYHTCGVTTGESVECWGCIDNDHGQCDPPTARR